MRLTVRDLAHTRAGDKGHAVNVSVTAFDDAGYQRLERELTEARVMQAFAAVADGPVRRYRLPGLRALNFVIDHIRGGGVTATLAQDIHGKSLSSLMLTIDLPGNEPQEAGQAALRSEA
ncbi:MAG TPA: hypothetical protein VGB88_08650 [Alphaproteobacteria bacterium]